MSRLVNPHLRVAISLVEAINGEILTVWNRGRQGWSLPGGKAMTGERLEACQARELYEETGLRTVTRELCYIGGVETYAPEDEGVEVYLYRVIPKWSRTSAEEGSAVRWMEREELIETSPFHEFYRLTFAFIPIRPGHMLNPMAPLHQRHTKRRYLR